jgi:glycosyl transferase, family 25
MNELPPIWIVSLERASHRRSAVALEFDALDLPFEFIEAVDGRALTDEQAALYSHWRALFEMGRGLSQGVFGCSLSHLRLYERMVTEDIPVVAIFEDDIKPTPDLRVVLESIHELPSDWQVVTLHSLFASADPQPIDDRLVAGMHQVCTYRSGLFGTQGYIINLDAARRVLEVGYPVAFPADELLFRAQPARLVRYGIEPTVLVHDDVASEIHSQPQCVVPERKVRLPLEWLVVVAGKIWRRAVSLGRRDGVAVRSKGGSESAP